MIVDVTMSNIDQTGLDWVLLPVPSLEGVAGSLEQIALHDHAVRSIHIELQVGIIIVRKILQ